MINLLKETTHILEQHKKTLNDIEYIYLGDKCIKSKNVDLNELLNFEYDDGYGKVEINTVFRLVGKDFWLERDEEDGSEWWKFETKPSFKNEVKEIKLGELLTPYGKRQYNEKYKYSRERV